MKWGTEDKVYETDTTRPAVQYRAQQYSTLQSYRFTAVQFNAVQNLSLLWTELVMNENSENHPNKSLAIWSDQR